MSCFSFCMPSEVISTLVPVRISPFGKRTRTGRLIRGGQGRLGASNTVAARLIFVYGLFMASSIVRTEKRSRGRPKTDAQSIHLTLVPSAISALDAYIATLPEGTSRPEAIRLILADWLTGAGFIKFREDPEGAN